MTRSDSRAKGQSLSDAADSVPPVDASNTVPDDAQPPDEDQSATSGADNQVVPAGVGLRRLKWKRFAMFGVLPAVALVLALAAGFLRWKDTAARGDDNLRTTTVQIAKGATVRLLSYRPDTVERDLTTARDLLTGDFRNSYTSLTSDVVIPGAKQKQITAIATVPAAASVSASQKHAVVLVFVDQSVTVGANAPSDSASAVRVSLDNVNGRWLISGFDPV